MNDFLNTPTLFVVHPEEVYATAIQDQLGYAGCYVQTFTTLEAFLHAFQQTPNVLVLMSTDFPPQKHAGIAAISQLQQGRQQPIPVMFLSSDNSIASRLAALRAGGLAYFDQSSKTSDMLEQIDRVTNIKPIKSYRILLIDDFPDSQLFHALQKVGMKLEIASNPERILFQINNFHPDLILIDNQLSQVPALELAQVIRQMPTLSHLPILLMEANTDRHYQQPWGEFRVLKKPINPEYLIQNIIKHIRYDGVLQSQMLRDNLTGLFKQNAFRNLLSREIARATRGRELLTLAMIEIDNLVEINHDHNHQLGDLTIQHLAHLLKQRLRNSDLIARYGGNRFVAIMINCAPENGLHVINQIRQHFAQHPQPNTEVYATLSGGVAGLADFSDMDSLLEASEQALNKAIQLGGNQIQTADISLWEQF